MPITVHQHVLVLSIPLLGLAMFGHELLQDSEEEREHPSREGEGTALESWKTGHSKHRFLSLKTVLSSLEVSADTLMFVQPPMCSRWR